MCENMNTSALVRFAHSRVTLVKIRNKFHISVHPSFTLSLYSIIEKRQLFL